MKKQNWLDRQLEVTRVTVGSWSERKKAALKAQISDSSELPAADRAREPRQSRGEKKASSGR
jgi:hypothetical protein